jgi:ABC-type long-subunit fatty acid transport system fused permease/ATPase subunit
MNLLRIYLTTLTVVFFAHVAMAQKQIPLDKNNQAKNATDRKQTLNFEDELVEGSAQKPELFYLFQKKNFNYKRLVKLRENFLPEMRKTTEDIQRLRGGN